MRITVGNESTRYESKDGRRFIQPLRTRNIIEAAEEECLDKVWYHRMRHRQHTHIDHLGQEHDEQHGDAAAKRIEDKYGIEELEQLTDYECGLLAGKLSALRWVLGSKWDFLDT